MYNPKYFAVQYRRLLTWYKIHCTHLLGYEKCFLWKKNNVFRHGTECYKLYRNQAWFIRQLPFSSTKQSKIMRYLCWYHSMSDLGIVIAGQPFITGMLGFWCEYATINFVLARTRYSRLEIFINRFQKALLKWLQWMTESVTPWERVKFKYSMNIISIYMKRMWCFP